MKKRAITFAFYLMFLMVIPFAIQAQDMARVTVTIKRLIAISGDMCNGKLDFFGKIKIGDAVKSFPVKEAVNDIVNVNWQFSTTTAQNTANISLEIWDDDDAFCGAEDDRVCVDGAITVIKKSFSSLEIKNQDFLTRGNCNGNNFESAAIDYNITIEPTKTAYLIQGIWKQVKTEIKTGSGEWEQPLNTSGSPNCRADDFFIFNKNASYKLYAGADKCVPPQPASKSGTWSFQNNDTKLQLNFPDASLAIIYTMHWIDKTKMMLSTSSTSGGVTVYNRYTYGH
jgi:hypothetical protein